MAIVLPISVFTFFNITTHFKEPFLIFVYISCLKHGQLEFQVEYNFFL